MIKFDARAAKALAPGNHLTYADAPGLRLVRSTTRWSWIYRYKNGAGLMKQARIGAWPAVSVAAAVVEWEKLRQARDTGTDPAAQRKAARQAAEERKARAALPTVFDIVDEYVEGHLKATTGAYYHRVMRRMVDGMLGETGAVVACEVTRTQAFELIDGHKGSPAAAHRFKQLLGAAWDHALDAGRLSANVPNWWRLVLRGKLQSQGRTIKGKKVGTAKRVLSDREVGQLIGWLPNFSPVVRDVLTLYLWTACRGAEIVTMEACDVAEEVGGQLWWTIPKRKRKIARHEAATDLRVPLVGRADEVVRRRLQVQPTGFLFQGDRTPHVRQHSISTAVFMSRPDTHYRPEYERPRLTIAHWAPHDLRRTARTMLAALGCPSDVAEAIIGHVQPGIENIYNRYTYDRERVGWLKRLDARLEQLAASA